MVKVVFILFDGEADDAEDIANDAGAGHDHQHHSLHCPAKVVRLLKIFFFLVEQPLSLVENVVNFTQIWLIHDSES